jgi:hypothetical protein
VAAAPDALALARCLRGGKPDREARTLEDVLNRSLDLHFNGMELLEIAEAMPPAEQVGAPGRRPNTLLTLVTAERLERAPELLRRMCAGWTGRLAAAFYVASVSRGGNASSSSGNASSGSGMDDGGKGAAGRLLTQAVRAAAAADGGRGGCHVRAMLMWSEFAESDAAAAFTPINALRNAAVTLVSTELFAVIPAHARLSVGALAAHLSATGGMERLITAARRELIVLPSFVARDDEAAAAAAAAASRAELAAIGASAGLAWIWSRPLMEMAPSDDDQGTAVDWLRGAPSAYGLLPIGGRLAYDSLLQEGFSYIGTRGIAPWYDERVLRHGDGRQPGGDLHALELQARGVGLKLATFAWTVASSAPAAAVEAGGGSEASTLMLATHSYDVARAVLQQIRKRNGAPAARPAHLACHIDAPALPLPPPPPPLTRIRRALGAVMPTASARPTLQSRQAKVTVVLMSWGRWRNIIELAAAYTGGAYPAVGEVLVLSARPESAAPLRHALRAVNASGRVKLVDVREQNERIGLMLRFAAAAEHAAHDLTLIQARRELQSASLPQPPRCCLRHRRRTCAFSHHCPGGAASFTRL